jgi:hypothetical protein
MAMEADLAKTEPPERKRHLLSPKRIGLLLGLLAAEVFIRLAVTLRWFGFDVNPGRTAIIALGVPLILPLLSLTIAWLYRRSRLQFSLRALMIIVTAIAAICAYVSWQVKIIRERAAALAEVNNVMKGSYTPEDQISGDHRIATVPWPRRLFGDTPINSIDLPPETAIDSRRRLSSLFPEARIYATEQYGQIGETKFYIRVPFHKPDSTDGTGD